MKTDGTNALPESISLSPERRLKITKTCQVCSKPLTGQQAMYCSKSCANTARKNKVYKRVCIQCGKSFDGKAKQNLCSNACRTQRRREVYAERLKDRKSYTKQCETCKKMFLTVDFNRDFCSYQCKETAKYHDPRFTDPASPYLIDGYTIISVEDEYTVMTEGDIRTWYRDAKNKRYAVEVLADMNLCSRKKIKTIVYKGTDGHVASKTRL